MKALSTPTSYCKLSFLRQKCDVTCNQFGSRSLQQRVFKQQQSRFKHIFIERGEIKGFKTKCRFQAALVRIEDKSDVKKAVDELLQSDKKVKKATHPAMYAYHLSSPANYKDEDKEKGNQMMENSELGESSGFDDCGEAGSGKVLLQLLKQTVKQHSELEYKEDSKRKKNNKNNIGHSNKSEASNASPYNLLVIVTRWYGML